MKDRLPARIELLEARIAPAAAIFDLATLDGTNGFSLSAIDPNDFLGWAVNDAGDVNGDGFDDVIVGTAGAGVPEYGPGTTFVVFGSRNGFPPDLNVAALDGTNGFRVTRAKDPAFGEAHLVSSVSGAGDVNGDGFDDVIIGIPRAPKSDPGYLGGESYVVFGKQSGFAADLNLAELDGTNGFKITGETSGDLAGYSVSEAGDVNGDGFADVIISARGDSDGVSTASYVVFGKESGFAPELNLAALDGSNGFKISGLTQTTQSVIAKTAVGDAGDVNGDGFDDVIIGSSKITSGYSFGSAYVVFGRQSGFAPELQVATLDGSNGFKVSGVAPRDRVGWSVSNARDVNGDGFADVIIGAPADGLTSGANYVVFGKAGGFAADLNLSGLDGSNGFKMSGAIPGDHLGPVSDAGDVNGDGFYDLIVGAVSDSNTSAGTAYVVFGRATGFSAEVNLAALDGRAGFQVSGTGTRSDGFALSVSGAGDVNGDGFDDVIIGAPGANATYVIFGFDARLNVASDGKSITFTDVDGDLVKIETSAGQFARHDVRLAADGTLQLIDLSDQVGLFSGANLTITAESSGAGDGLVNVGAIDASGVRLGKITIAGDLGQIDAGDGTEALRSLSVRTLGALGAGTQAPGTSDPLSSELLGSVGKLSVQRVLMNAHLSVHGKLQTVLVGSDVIDASLSAKKIRSFTVMGDLQDSQVIAEISIKNIEVMGRLVGNDSTAPALLAAMGKTSSTNPKQSIALDKIVIHDDVINAQILAGYNKLGEPKNPSACIGTVVVKGSWVGSSLVAGVQDMTRDGFGRGDVLIPGGTRLVASIAKIVIEGSATGTSVDGDFFGITANRLGKLIISGMKQPLGVGPNDILLGRTTDDFRAVDFS